MELALVDFYFAVSSLETWFALTEKVSICVITLSMIPAKVFLNETFIDIVLTPKALIFLRAVTNKHARNTLTGRTILTKVDCAVVNELATGSACVAIAALALEVTWSV